MIGALSIAAGYISLVWAFGWGGLAACVALTGILLLAMPRR